MTFDYSIHKEMENIVPFCLEDKKRYYYDLMNIESSWTGRIDAMYSNEFFREAVQLIINSIVLFEKGYFDCALYSLRQSMEVCTTIIYFVDDSEDNAKSEMKKWKNQEKFPMNNQMLNELQKRQLVFADIKNKMFVFFDEVEESKRKINKYVHKQGFDKFYVSRNNPLKSKEAEKLNAKLFEDYKAFLIKSIGVIAVFRLAIDPFPLLLRDDEMYSRTGQLMTEAYGDSFVEKYIGEDNIAAYKKTDLYQQYFNAIIKGEEMCPSVLNVVKDDYIDRSKIEEIYSQIHLLGIYEKIAVAFVELTEKISNIYIYGGLTWYFTDIESKRRSTGHNSNDFKNIKDKKYNISFQEVFLSGLEVCGELFYLEHNEKFNSSEINQLNSIVENFNTSYQQLKDEVQNLSEKINIKF